MPMLILLWVTGEEGGREEEVGGWSRKGRGRSRKEGEGEGKEINPTFQMRTIIKLIA